MHEITCPHCQTAFKIDEAGYAEILKQVRDRDFEQQLQERLSLAEREKQAAVEIAAQKVTTEMQKIAASKDAEIQDLKASMEARDLAQQLAITEAVTTSERQRDLLAGELQQLKESHATAHDWLRRSLPRTYRRSHSRRMVS